MKASLRWKILGWFFLNAAVLAGVLFLFLRVQFRVGLNSLLSGSTEDRLEAIARPLATQLRQHPMDRWNATLAGAVAAWRERGIKAAIYGLDGALLAGDADPLPPEVLEALKERDHHGPLLPEDGSGFHRGHGGPHSLFDDRDRHRGEPHRGLTNSDAGSEHPEGHFDDPDGQESDHPGPPPESAFGQGRLDKFMLVAGSPRRYWAGVLLGDVRPPSRGRPPQMAALLLSSTSLRGGGLFFDYAPWLGLGGTMAVLSVLLWLPFVRGLTRSIKRMTYAAEEIAQGHFEPPAVDGRRDELGRLGRALGHMALRLEGFVTDQKRFLGDTAHELLSPLARLEVALSILETRAGPGAEAITARALEDVRQTAALVQDLLSFSKAGMHGPATALEPVLLANLVDGVVRLEGGAAAIAVDIDPTLRVCAAGELLARAVANGVRNAVRYAGDAGPIQVSARASEDEVTLTIADAGPGVPEAALPRLFDPFYRPESARSRETGGVGLGLAIVKNCVEAGGGRVAVRNRQPTGLELELTLQRAG